MKLPIFDRLDRKVIYKSFWLAFRRGKLYKKKSVLIKEIILFMLIVLFSFETEKHIKGAYVFFIIIFPYISLMLIDAEIRKYVIPLIPKAIIDVREFPDIRK